MNDPQAARARFAVDLLGVNVRLPLSISKDCQATIVDADGRDVATIDMNRERPDAEAVKMALWIVLAVNICGGSLATLPLFLEHFGSALDTKGSDHA